MKKRINITIDEKLIKNFQEYCRDKGMKVSTRIELLVKEDIKNK
ncbi:MAG: CopG family transcriptional regulator [Nanoarchaeota archaeon]|nr:CopG family transcriptional regulator [Nanoarchaeota archaeon]